MATILYRTQEGYFEVEVQNAQESSRMVDANGDLKPIGLVMDTEELNDSTEMTMEDIKEIVNKPIFIREGVTILEAAGRPDANEPASSLMSRWQRSTLKQNVLGTLQDVCFDLHDGSVCFLEIKMNEGTLRVVVDDIRDAHEA